MYIYEIKIPGEVKTLAVPVNSLQFFLSRKNDTLILVIKKAEPCLGEWIAGARHRYKVKLAMLPRGGIALTEQKEEIEEKMGGVYFYKKFTRELPTAVIEAIFRSFRWKENFKCIDELRQYVEEKIKELKGYDIRAKGFLVFERISENEWKLTKEKPEAWIYLKSYSLHSRTCCARYEVVSSDAFDVKTFMTSTTLDSVATLICIAPYPTFKLYYKYESGPYRGDCETIEVKKKITLKDMKSETIEEQEFEELEESEVL